MREASFFSLFYLSISPLARLTVRRGLELGFGNRMNDSLAIVLLISINFDGDLRLLFTRCCQAHIAAYMFRSTE